MNRKQHTALLFLPLVVGLALLTGACGAPLALTGASYAADGGSLLASDKTVTDHLASMVSKKDCALWRVVRGRPVCKEREGDEDPYDVDYGQPQRMASEEGVQYVPPLRASANAPAASWDSGAYESEPAPAPVTAVAEAGGGPAPSTVQPAPRAKKAKTTSSARKSSRGRAAPAF